MVDGKEISFSKLFVINGSFQIIVGIGLVVLDIIIFKTERFYLLYHTAGASGIWLGIFFILTGILGIFTTHPVCNIPASKFLNTTLYLNTFTSLCSFVLLLITIVMVTWAMASTRENYAFQLLKAICYLGMFGISLCQSIVAALNVYKRSLLKRHSSINSGTDVARENAQYMAGSIASIGSMNPKVHKAFLEEPPRDRAPSPRYVQDRAPSPRYVEDVAVGYLPRTQAGQPRYLEHHL